MCRIVKLSNYSKYLIRKKTTLDFFFKETNLFLELSSAPAQMYTQNRISCIAVFRTVSTPDAHMFF